MKKFILVSAIIFLFCSVFAFDELWQKASALAESSKNLVAGKTTVDMKIAGKKENDPINAEMKMVFATFVGEDGELKTEVVSHELISDADDEIDVSVDASDKGSDNDKKKGDFDLSLGSSSSSNIGIFRETNPKNLTVKPIKETQHINGKMCQGYDVQFTPDGDKKQRIAGKMWIEIVSGIPIMFDFKMSKTPMFVKSIQTKAYYTFNEEKQQIFVEKAESYTISSILFIRVAMDMFMTFEDFFEFEKP